jgi:oxygen-dependent protoporphyrinogen oxidase
MTRARVVGAGLSGLATAWYLAEGGARVHVIEAAGRAGGLIQTLRTPEGLVETAAPAFTSSERVLALFSALGVEACVPNPATAKRYIFRGGRPRRWPLSALETSATLLRLGTAWIAGQHRPRGEESLGEWGRRVVGQSALEWLLAPVSQIYAASPDALAAVAVRGGRRRRGKRISPRRGMQELVDRLAETLSGRGVRFSFNERVAALDPSVPTAICTSAPAAAVLLQSSAPRLSDALARVRMVSLVTATAFFRPSGDDLRGAGVLFPRSSNVGALGVLFNSDVFPDRSQLRSETWIYSGPSSLSTDGVDEEDFRRRLEADRALLTGRTERPVAVYITARPNALPLYDAALLKVVAIVEELPATVALAGNYLGSLGVSRLVDGGADAAARLLRVQPVSVDSAAQAFRPAK